jgi:hypothetical protein
MAEPSPTLGVPKANKFKPDVYVRDSAPLSRRTIARKGQKFGRRYLLNVLRASLKQKLKSFCVNRTA